MIARDVLARAYLSGKSIAQHQIDSFNRFIDEGLQRVIDEQPILETSITGEDEKGKFKICVKFGKISVGEPRAREADGSYDRILPAEARLRNLTYAAPMTLRMRLVKKYEALNEGAENAAASSGSHAVASAEAASAAEGAYFEEFGEEEEIPIGELPIMVKSKKCALHGLSAKELADAGEDPLDPGGYFIVNGAEHVLITLEDLATNRIFVNFEERYGGKTAVAKVFSEKHGFRVPVRVEISRKGIIEVSIPAVSSRIEFVMLARALGLESDEEIVNAVSDDPEIQKYVWENCLLYTSPSPRD